jgi:hypothetical protein
MNTVVSKDGQALVHVAPEFVFMDSGHGPSGRPGMTPGLTTAGGR